jgi:hypothetical protein
MPYRRLPKTDQTRLAALNTAIRQGEKDGIYKPVISLKMQHEAKTFLSQYEQSLSNYKQAVNNQKESIKKAHSNVKQTRLYISHFIQVLNMSIIRDELKKTVKTFYELDPESNSVPDLTSEKAILKWGERIIKGENERMRSGGTPIYNPNINKVKVYFDIFKENINEQKIYLSNINRYSEAVQKMRNKCDEIILNIWNEVETHFSDMPWKDRIDNGKKYGLIYYYRRGEDTTDNVA